jgi:hypothetical protein
VIALGENSSNDELFAFLKNGKDYNSNYKPGECFDNYLYWLGICNYRDGDLIRAYISFICAAYSERIKAGAEKYCYLAVANCVLLKPDITTGVEKGYRNCIRLV